MGDIVVRDFLQSCAFVIFCAAYIFCTAYTFPKVQIFSFGKIPVFCSATIFFAPGTVSLVSHDETVRRTVFSGNHGQAVCMERAVKRVPSKCISIEILGSL